MISLQYQQCQLQVQQFVIFLRIGENKALDEARGPPYGRETT